MREFKRELKHALQQVENAMMPILDSGFLRSPFDEAEAEVLDAIRVHYVPELILGYNSVLFFAGYSLSRTWLGSCMELANTVACSPSLTEVFIVGGRMRELVSALAQDSQSLLSANEQGAKKMGEKKTKNLDIWTVQWKDMDKPLVK